MDKGPSGSLALTFLKMFMPRSEARSGTACRRRFVRETFANVSVLRDFPSSLHYRHKSCRTQQRIHDDVTARTSEGRHESLQKPLRLKFRPLLSRDIHRIHPLSSCHYLSLVGVDQGRRCSHHGAAARPWQRRDQGFRGAFGSLLQDLPQPLQVVHQGPVHALLRPVWLQQAAQHCHVKVSGITRSLGQGGWQAGGG